MRGFILVPAVALLLASPAFGQGLQTGTIRGAVTDQQHRAVPGVTVTVSSKALQQPRAVATDLQGFYAATALPAGDYFLKFELDGFAAVNQTIALPLGLSVEANAEMRPATVSETVTVVAETPAQIVNPAVGANFKHEQIEKLANPRTLFGIAQLSPGLTQNGPQNKNQLVINGAFAFDNVFMINGVDVNDNLLAQPQDLFVEDAIAETQVLTSGLPAEFGRFTGGVVNAITKSGGEIFSGSGRVDFSNPSWTTATPYEVSKGIAATAHQDSFQSSYETTLGGPLVRRRLWFFASGRTSSIDTTRSLPQTGMTVPSNDSNKRGEIKLTGRVADHQSIQFGFLNNPREQTNTSGVQNFVITPDSEANPITRNWYYYGNYRGVLRSATVVEAQYSQRRWKVDNSGGSSTNLLDSPFLSTECACLYNGPYFDSTDPEQRNNAQATGSVTNFWNRGGAHETKLGYEFYRSQRRGGGSQSSTSYVFNSDFASDASGALLDADGHVIPAFVPGVSSVDFYPAVRGATMNIDNNSLYLQDHWAVNRHWSADLGARYEHVKAVSTGGVIGVDNHRIVPRLAVAYDVRGDGNHIIHVTYGLYSGRYNENQIGANSSVGNPPQLTTVYTGPAGEGRDFAPGFDLSNYPVSGSSAARVPGANVLMDPNLKSPVVREFTTGYGINLFGGHGYAETTYVHRRTVDLIEDFQTMDGGVTEVTLGGVDAGLFTNTVYRNSDQAYRVFDSLLWQAQYRFNERLMVGGHYTLQLRNKGNYEGEMPSQPGKPSFIGNYPEAFSAARNFPDGNLQDFQRQRLRLWGIYDVPMGRFGHSSVSGLWRVDSALTYSLRATSQPLTKTQMGLIAAAGYPDSPNTTDPTAGYYVFFGERGSEKFKGYGVFDTSFNYDIPVRGTLRPWVKLDVYNLFDNQKLIAWDVRVNQDPTSPKDSLGLATGYVKRSTFGTATGNTISLSGLTVNAYPVAFPGALPGGRTIRLAVGFRF
jgi:Carboxypeptidase regulatory-like domain/TonB dependent receptor-like, beta-barrel